jgi:tetratricopeptide (TPR) repeat protein
MKSRNFLLMMAVFAAAALPIISLAQQSKSAAGASTSDSARNSLPSQQKADSQAAAKSSVHAAPEQAEQPYAKEPFVIEKYVTRIRFENDGTGERALQVRVRAQSVAGVQELKSLVFGYNAKRETVSVGHVKVIKKGGAAKDVGADAVKDLESPLVKDAPAYAESREKQVTVEGLEEGSVIDYEVDTKINSAMIPNEFCYEHNFVDAAVVLDEQLEINVPAGREVTIRSARSADSKHEADGRVIYLWKHSNLTVHSKDANGESGAEAGADSAGTAGNQAGGAGSGGGGVANLTVELTSFKSWDEVGQWYAKGYAQGPGSEAAQSEEIRAKATELTKDCKTEHEKIAALYIFIAQKIRYVSLPFGDGQYRPLKPAEILKNGYGDSQDKHFLLAALLDAVGVHAEPVLASSTRNLNEQAPSPAQFDHLITTIPKNAEGKQIWLDSTADVAPFEYLLPNLRGKNALVVAADGNVKIEKTPENPPFPSTEIVNVDAKLSELGKLTAKVDYQLRGDNEFAFRSAFHRTPESGWNQIGQTVALLDGLQGQVSNVHAKDPLDTSKPFEFTLDFAQKRAADWAQKKSTINVPLPSLGMPPAPKNDVAVSFGTPLDVTLHLKLDYPEADTLAAPVGVTVMRDYADYRSSYKVEGHALQVQRVVRFKMSEVAADHAEDYRAFTRAALADQNQPIAVSRTPKDANAVASSAKADELVEAGDTALDAGNAQAAIDLLRRAARLEPSRKDIWNNLGLAYLRLGQPEPAINAFQTQIRLNIHDPIAHDYLGAAFLQQHKEEDAAGAFRKQLEINPLDKFAHASLGVLYFEQQKYSDALPELEKAAILNPDNAQIEITLGKCYLKTGKTPDARTAFDKAAQISPTAEILNGIASELAANNLDLDKAQQYAAAAVKEMSDSSRDLDFDHVTLKDFADVQDLSADWATLGLVYFRQGDLDNAVIYLRSAWLLTQNSTTGKYLTEVYEKQGHKDLAAKVDAKEEARTYAVAPVGGVTGNADFLILVGAATKDAKAGARAERVKFVSGSETLKAAEKQIEAADFEEMIPAGSSAKVLRRGTLRCTAGECKLVLELPQDVKSLD